MLYTIFHSLSLPLLSSFFGRRTEVSKARRVFTQLNPPVIVFSKISRFQEIITFDISLSIHPLKELAELHFLGLKP